MQSELTFAHANSGNAKGKNENQENIQLENPIYRVLNERGNITGFFAEHLNFPV